MPFSCVDLLFLVYGWVQIFRFGVTAWQSMVTIPLWLYCTVSSLLVLLFMSISSLGCIYYLVRVTVHAGLEIGLISSIALLFVVDDVVSRL